MLLIPPVLSTSQTLKTLSKNTNTYFIVNSKLVNTISNASTSYWKGHLNVSPAPALHCACATHSRAPLSWRWRAEATGVNQEENAAQLAQLTTRESAEVAGGHREDASPSSTFPEAGGGAIPPPVWEFWPLPGALPVKCLDSVATSTAVRR